MLVCLGLAGCAGAPTAELDATPLAAGPPTPPAQSSPAPPRYEDLWARVRAGLALPSLENRHVRYFETWYASRPEYVSNLVARAQRYLYYIVEQVEARGMPMEIALLPAIESAFRPHAYSRARAVGLWQFIGSTGRLYGLKQDWWYDGRRDVVAATDSALDYLEKLHQEFNGDWFHALAAYNAGERRVGNAIKSNRRRGQNTDYNSLRRLKRETRQYVPKLIAFANIVRNPARYGLQLASIPNAPYFVAVDAGAQIDLGVVTKMLRMKRRDFLALNAGYRRAATPPGGPHRLLVPVDRQGRLSAGLAALPPAQRLRWTRHRVRRGETLGHIARRYGVSVAHLRKSNRIRRNLIRAGQDLVIPLSAQRFASAAARRPRPVAGIRDATHDVKAGDTLGQIAQHYGVSASRIRNRNRLRGNLIRAGQTLVIPGPRTPARATTVVAISTNNAVGKKIVHEVRRGDTLWGIAQHYGVYVKQLARWNRINTRAVLKPGQGIIVLR